MHSQEDRVAREKALTIDKSYIVQAPAGSGKTELLTQRYLALLAHVEKNPEQILAITFTRKAAQEMQARIMEALHNAQDQTQVISDQEKMRRELALAVLVRDKKEGWELLANPNRLMIKTIDSLCSSIVQQMPILAQFGALPRTKENAHDYYNEAAREIILSGLSSQEKWAEAVVHLVEKQDNDLNKVQKLLAEMLSYREQWLQALLPFESKNQLKKILESVLKEMVNEKLQHLVTTISFEQKNELFTIMRFAGSYCEPGNDYRDFENFLDIPSAEYVDLKRWRLIAGWLLTGKGEWRKRYTKAEGLPGESTLKNKEEKEKVKEIKERLKELLNSFLENPTLLSIMTEVKYLPNPEYSEEDLDFMMALISLLPRAAAQLRVLFSERGEVDFTHITHAALSALGDAGDVTDIALALDYRFQHILVDEFQDTSFVQWELLEKLTAGWEANEGRTLFLVGDPMQSIYRFRQAEVSLFLQAQQQGIGQIKLEPLYLRMNFRSKPALIKEINHYFRKIFPKESDLLLGAVPYWPSQALSDEEEISTSSMQMHYFEESIHNEAPAIVKVIEQHYQDEKIKHIAILVRAKTHLLEILPALNDAGIAYNAVEIEALTERPVIQDLLALTCALLHLSDKTAWLALLRAPWCGLNLDEILTISQKSETSTVWDALNQADNFSHYNKIALDRVVRLKQCLEVSLKEQGRQPLREWIFSAWLTLGGPSIHTGETAQANAFAFFDLLEKLDQQKKPISRHFLYEEVDRLFAKPILADNAKVHIMTIHKAKGLEFDVVIIPSLEKGSATNAKKLLEHLEIPSIHGARKYIFSSMPDKNMKNNPIYDYIGSKNKEKEALETARLFYVGMTRAKKQIHLFSKKKENETVETIPSGRNFLGLIQPFLEERNIVIETDNVYFPIEKGGHYLKRITSNWKLPSSLALCMPFAQMGKITPSWQALNANNPDNHYEWQYSIAHHIGTLIHEILFCIVKQGLSVWKNKDLTKCYPFWKVRLAELGVNLRQQDEAIAKVHHAIYSTLSDEKGLWILSEHHDDNYAEYTFSALVNNKINIRRIDRTFIDNNTNERWIVDYKTSSPESNESLETFLRREEEQYRSQLLAYYSLYENQKKFPVRMGLYFPMIQAWQEIKM